MRFAKGDYIHYKRVKKWSGINPPAAVLRANRKGYLISWGCDDFRTFISHSKARQFKIVYSYINNL